MYEYNPCACIDTTPVLVPRHPCITNVFVWIFSQWEETVSDEVVSYYSHYTTSLQCQVCIYGVWYGLLYLLQIIYMYRALVWVHLYSSVSYCHVLICILLISCKLANVKFLPETRWWHLLGYIYWVINYLKGTEKFQSWWLK